MENTSKSKLNSEKIIKKSKFDLPFFHIWKI